MSDSSTEACLHPSFPVSSSSFTKLPKLDGIPPSLFAPSFPVCHELVLRSSLPRSVALTQFDGLQQFYVLCGALVLWGVSQVGAASA